MPFERCPFKTGNQTFFFNRKDTRIHNVTIGLFQFKETTLQEGN